MRVADSNVNDIKKKRNEASILVFFKFKDGVFHYIRTQFPPPPSL